MAQQTPSLSVVINTKNSADTLKACLRSVKNLADEIIVMDMQSSDDTLRIARSFDATIKMHPDVGYVEPARNAAIAIAKCDWILVIDADEEVPPSLAKEIRKNLITDERVDAYFLPRKNLIFDRWVKSGWWPDHILRLFRRGTVNWPSEIHAVPAVNGTVKRLPARESLALVHHNYPDLDSYWTRAQRYAHVTAKNATARGELLHSPLDAFMGELFQRYYGWDGQHDGSHGVILSLLQANTKILESAAQWEQRQYADDLPPLALSQTLRRWANDARYWELLPQVEASSWPLKLWWKLRLWLRW